MGSASEVEYQLLLCRELGFLLERKYLELEKSLTECRKLLNSFIQTLKRSER